jgi:hypothetical protein
MRNTIPTFVAGLLVATMALPALMAPPALADPSGSPPPSFGGAGNGTGNGTGNSTGATIVVTLSGPSRLAAGGSGDWAVNVSYPAAGNNTTATTHHVALAGALVGANGTVTLDPAEVDVTDGGTATATAHVTLDAAHPPTEATLVVNATSGADHGAGSARFLIVAPPSPLHVRLAGPSSVVAGTSGTWTVYVSWGNATNGTAGNGTAGNNTTAVLHHVHLDPALFGAPGSVSVWPPDVDVAEGGTALAYATVTLPVTDLPGQASLRIEATSGSEDVFAYASFLVI